MIRPGTNPQIVLNAHPNGTRFCFASGTHRISSTLVPKYGQVLDGFPNAVLTGAIVLRGWSASGRLWVHRGGLPAAYSMGGHCENKAVSDCTKAEQVFVNGRKYTRVNSISAVRSGTFYTDYATNRTYLANDPRSSFVELSRTRVAIRASAGRVQVRNLHVMKFASASQRGAIEVGPDALIANCDVRFNHGLGVYFTHAPRAQLWRSNIHHNGQLGVGVHRSPNFRVYYNNLTDNNTDRFWVADWESGGIKITWSSGVVFSNWVYHNKGVGVWGDIENRGVNISRNWIVANDADGVRFEISSYGLVIANYISTNGFGRGRNTSDSLWDGGGVNVNTSDHVTVQQNTIVANRNSVSLQSRTRGTSTTGYRFRLHAVLVRWNTIDASRTSVSKIGIVGNAASPPGAWRYYANNYVLGSTKKRYVHFNSYAMLVPSGWQARKQDLGSRFR